MGRVDVIRSPVPNLYDLPQPRKRFCNRGGDGQGIAAPGLAALTVADA
jgi:hypothetical protein